MEIPLKAPVECTDGVVGRSAYILIDPASEKVTHLVVKENATPHAEYLVPIDQVVATISGTIKLHCSEIELHAMTPFVQTEFVEESVSGQQFWYGGNNDGPGHSYLPYALPDVTVQIPVEHRQIPPGELAVQRETQVNAIDGQVGKVDEVVINPENGDITCLVMREGPMWDKKHVIIPRSELEEIGEEAVSLKLDKQEVEALPTFPVHRR